MLQEKDYTKLNLIYFGQKNPDFDYKDLKIIKQIGRLARKHQRQCVNSCNGYGIVNGQMYYSGMSYGQEPGEYEKREYGYNVKSAYTNKDNENCIFDVEADRLEDKIKETMEKFYFDKYALWKVKPYRVEFQGDPRGFTVKLYYNKQLVNNLF